MPENTIYLPEGLRPQSPLPLAALREAMERRTILEAPVTCCDCQRDLHVDLGGQLEGVIPRSEAVAPWISGADRDIALLSRVGKPACFFVTGLGADEKGAPLVRLSRRAVQEQAGRFFSSQLRPGAVVAARVTHLESFGAFLDIGCGVIAMLPIERISVSRIPHPKERFQVGQRIFAAVASIDPAIPRFTMTHRELLGTWLENASRFCPGETVRGVVRSVKDYGSFIELAPNLSGLAEDREGLSPGDGVSVYIKSIQPDRMKIKLQIIAHLPGPEAPGPIRYQVTDGQLTHWVYSPPGCSKLVETDFTSTP
jgi:small subunit ribosomal protein S1